MVGLSPQRLLATQPFHRKMLPKPEVHLYSKGNMDCCVFAHRIHDSTVICLDWGSSAGNIGVLYTPM